MTALAMDSVALAIWCETHTHLLRAPFDAIKMVSLPRQARGKHGNIGKALKKRCVFRSQEAHLGFAALAIRATSDFAAVLKHAGQAEQAANYTATAMRLAKELRARPSTTGRGEEWYTDYGADGKPYF